MRPESYKIDTHYERGSKIMYDLYYLYYSSPRINEIRSKLHYEVVVLAIL